MKSLDQKENERYRPYQTPLDAPWQWVTTEGERRIECPPRSSISLDGTWSVAPDGYTDERLDAKREWQDAVAGTVPGSIHSMLLEAGVLEDPTFAKNDKRARENSYRVWWLKRVFSLEEIPADPTLHFDGIAYRAQIWLNGQYLGMHSGMFGGPDYRIDGLLQRQNTLIVKILNAPSNPFAYSEYADYDEGWRFGTVINCVYGWHYACIPSRGIWRSVHIDSTPRTVTEKPFFVPIDTNGTVDLILRTDGAASVGTVTVSVRPKNFEGKGCGFEVPFMKSREGKETFRYRFRVEDPHLWWPNGHGRQDLYETEVLFAPQDDLATFDRSGFGIRTVEMGPLPGGVREDRLNLTYIVNGKPIFVKGTNWCTTDVLLRFPRERYQRFLSLLKQQHVQLLRAWGGGMPETDGFYEFCDSLGIMVRQEWPTCWDSDRTQPEEELAETVERNLIRIRNHPSLVTLAGGNESHFADSPAMTRMARASYEYDGTRVFHKSSPFGGNESPYGGIIHSYITYWDRQEIDASLALEAPFIAEFGMASAPNLRSVQRYLPKDEKEEWPPREKGSFYYHMPRFNECQGAIDIDFIGKRVPEFSRAETMKSWIDATQLAQATVIRHVLEKMRSRWPESVGVCYYKATDVYPACSWSTIDYYGVPKLSYYVVQDAYAPLHAAIVPPSVKVREGTEIPVWLLSDGVPVPADCEIRVRFYRGDLTLIREMSFAAALQTEYTGLAGIVTADKSMAEAAPLLAVTEVRHEDAVLDRTFYWLNFQEKTGCLFDLPQATVKADVRGERLLLQNVSAVPAVGVTVECPEKDDSFTVSDNFIWIEPGEELSLDVSTTNGLTITGMNLQPSVV